MRILPLLPVLCVLLPACRAPEPKQPAWSPPDDVVRSAAQLSPAYTPRNISLLSLAPDGEVGVPYALRLRFSGDVPEPARYLVEGEGQPLWLLSDPGDPYLRFVPREAGSYAFTVGIGDPAEEVYYKFPLQIEVRAAAGDFSGISGPSYELVEVRLGAGLPGDASTLGDHRLVYGVDELASLVWGYAFACRGQESHFEETTRIFRAGDKIYQDVSTKDLPAQGLSSHGGTWGWETPGYWEPGQYQLLLWIDDKLAARVPFLVVDRSTLTTRVEVVLQPALQGVPWAGEIGLRSDFVTEPEYLITGLPEGLGFDARTGQIEGVPQAAGSFPLWVGVRDRVFGHDSDTRAGDTWYVPARRAVLEVREEMDRVFWRIASDYELRRGEPENARDLADQALGASQDIPCLLAKARALSALAEYRGAFELLDSAPLQEPEHRGQLAEAALLAGEGERCLEILAQLRIDQPGRPRWVAEQARAHFDLGRWLEAEALFDQALKLQQTEVQPDYLRLYRLACLCFAGDRDIATGEMLNTILATSDRSSYFRALVGVLSGAPVSDLDLHLQGVLPELRAERQCEGHFFAAVHALTSGARGRGLQLLDACLQAGVERYWEHRSALMLHGLFADP